MASVASNTSNLTKSQKKRMKQKASKAKREAESKKQEALAGANGNHQSTIKDTSALNPHEKLCSDLVRQGYTLPEIEVALEEMWNLGMKYDDFQSALIYLEAKKAQRKADAEKAAEEVVEEEVATLVENSHNGNMNGTHSKAEDENIIDTEVMETEKLDEKADSLAASPTTDAAPDLDPPQPPQPPQPMELAAKLDIVANHESLYDAILALAEWVNKAAKPDQLISLCNNSQSTPHPALYTIVQRAIQSPSNPEFEKLLPPLVSLTSGILLSSGNKSDPNMTNSFSETLIYVRDAVATSKANVIEEIDSIALEKAIVDTVANQICHSFQLIITNSLSSAKNQSNGDEASKGSSIQEIEQEIDAILADQPTTNVGDLKELMMRRDCRKGAAEKSSLVTKLVFPGQKTRLIQKQNIPSNLNDEGKVRLLSNLFDGHFHTYQHSRSSYMHLESRLDSLNSTWATERKQLSNAIDTCQVELKKLQQRKNELKRELETLDAKTDVISKQEDDLKERLELVYNSSSTTEVDNLKAELKKVARLAEVEEKVSGILDKFEHLENSLSGHNRDVINTDNQNLPLDSSEVEGKLQSFLILAKNYFITEADCVAFMNNRIVKTQNDVKDLQREIAECTALGMTTNVSKMQSLLVQNSGYIVEDEGVVSLLRRDAESMRDQVIERVTTYISVGNVLTPSLETVLISIGYILARIGIDSSHRLFNTSLNGNSVPNKTNNIFPGVTQNVLPTVSQETPLVVNESPPLKLSWASKSAPKSEVKSLVDIQKEELSRKD